MDEFEMKQKIEAIECLLSHARENVKEVREYFERKKYSGTLVGVVNIHHSSEKIDKLCKELRKELTQILGIMEEWGDELISNEGD